MVQKRAVMHHRCSHQLTSTLAAFSHGVRSAALNAMAAHCLVRLDHARANSQKGSCVACARTFCEPTNERVILYYKKVRIGQSIKQRHVKTSEEGF